MIPYKVHFAIENMNSTIMIITNSVPVVLRIRKNMSFLCNYF